MANRLALGKFEETDSTDGAWATHWPLPHAKKKVGVEREIWLWDFAGQVDYRLVHQLFMDDTAAVVLVFNPQNEIPSRGWGTGTATSGRRRGNRLPGCWPPRGSIAEAWW